MSNDNELFDDFTLSDLYKKIYINSNEKKAMIDSLIESVPTKIQSVDEVMMVMPILNDCIGLGIKNDETLVKLAGIITKGSNTKSTQSQLDNDDMGGFISEEDKKKLAEEAKAMLEQSTGKMKESIKNAKEKIDKEKENWLVDEDETFKELNEEYEFNSTTSDTNDEDDEWHIVR